MQPVQLHAHKEISTSKEDRRIMNQEVTRVSPYKCQMFLVLVGREE